MTIFFRYATFCLILHFSVMKPTPRQLPRFMFVALNLVSISAFIVPTSLSPLPPSLLFSPLGLPLLLPPLLLIVFINIFYHQLRQAKRYRALPCPVCNSADVSFGAGAADVALKKSGAAKFFLAPSIALLLLQLPWTRNLIATYPRLEPYFYAVALVFVLQLGKHRLIAAFRKRSEAVADRQIHWVCELCKHRGLADESAPTEHPRHLVG